MNEREGDPDPGVRRGIARRTVLSLAGVALAAGLGACGRAERTTAAASGELRAIAHDAYVFGYPFVLMDVTRTASLAVAPADRLWHATAPPTPERHDVVRMNLDTLYSSAWLDLSEEPVVVRMPAVPPGRFWLLQFMDAWSNTVHNPSAMRPQVRPGTTTPPYTYVITGPGWSGDLPSGLTPLPMPTPTVWLLGRIQVNGPDDVAAVRAIQQEMRVATLSDWIAGRETASTAAPPPTDETPAERVARMDPREFFDRLCARMRTDPPAPVDEPAMARFARIGVEPGGQIEGLAEEDLRTAVRDATQTIGVYVDPQTRLENGWTFDPRTGVYGTEYLHRAAVARKGLGANLPQDAIYPTFFGDADSGGVPNRFRLRFEAGALPPVDAFWSLTAYGADDRLVPNAAGIQSIGHEVPVVPAPDGSVELAIQNEDPGDAVPQGNWLPIPREGAFSLTLRMYAPHAEAIEGTWRLLPVTPI